MPFGVAQYGATILGFTNANPGVFSVNSSQFFQIGDIVRIANTVTSTGSNAINSDVTVTAISSSTITVDLDTTSLGSYVSGGFITILEALNPNNTPFLQGNLNQPLQPWTVFNQSIGSQIQSVPLPEYIPDYVPPYY